jgi:SAM-dependent methyltransferase
VDWIAAWLTAMRPNATVLDIGCCDGMVGIPLLQKCPGITYTACDINASALALVTSNAAKVAVDPTRITTYLIKPGEQLPAEVASQQYDAIIWSEVIEHVPDPVDDLRRIGELLKPDGFLFITTPWGAFDAGHPPAKTNYGTPRDARGHLRAITARDIVALLAESGHAPMDLYNAGSDAFIGDTMHVVVKPLRPSKLRPVAFAVHGALWDWNGRSVRALGMGASEETIVYLSSALAASRQVDVFCPTSAPDVNESVPYWPREHLRHLRKAPDTKVVVSRGPSYAINIDEMIGIELPKVLWLQDTYYPDLIPEITAKYETIVCVSEWHKQLMHDNHKVPLDKIVVAYNFLLEEHFNFPVWPKRKRDHFVYISSPDRGLVKLLTLWPRVLERYPNATLDVFYGWRGVEVLGTGKDSGWAARLTSQRTEYEKLRHQKGIKERGMINHQALALELQRASVWAYPTNFAETGCLSAAKARAAGCVPVTTALAALNETAKCDQSYLIDPNATDYDERWLDAASMAAETSDADRDRMAKDAIEQYRLEAVMPIWEKILR